MCFRCCILGCYNTQRKVNHTSYSLDPPPDRVPCTTCAMPMPTEYYQTVQYCCICFIPLCSIGKGEPYLACKRCGTQVANVTRAPCSKCGTSMPPGFNYCAQCGERVNYN